MSAAASDDVGVAGVQFRIDNVNAGPEQSSAPYTLAWDTTTAAGGMHVITAVARDAAGNTSVSSGVTVTVSNAAPADVCPCSLWDQAAVPSRIETSDTQPVELGVRFRADAAGAITGMRFYKSSGNTGAHVAHL